MDLRIGPPRRWNERLADIYWLPRLIDKARAALAGTLGSYLFGQSPMDHGLLRALGVSHRAFALLVKNAGDDEAVVAALHAHNHDALQRARAWSDPLPREHKLFLWFIDIDDGYVKAGLAYAVIHPLAGAISLAAKRFLPSRAAERARADGA